MTVVRRGDAVVLVCPENPRLHGRRGVVGTPTDYGAVVLTAAAATGQFRALHAEMAPDPDQAGGGPGAGYAGGECGQCGAMRLKRNGACLVCDACGANSGCG